MNTTQQLPPRDLRTDTFLDFKKYIQKINYNSEITNTITVERYLVSKNNSELNVSVVDNLVNFSLLRDKFSSKPGCIIICSKDNSHILKYCLEQIKKYGIDKEHDVLLVDDRSQTMDILKLSDEYETSYLRVENNNDIFNYSLLNNIAAMYCLNKNKELLIFYNNDLWPENEKTLPNIIDLHKKNKASITGCRLVYPTKEHYEELGNPQHLLEKYFDQLYSTIQHGGIFFDSPAHSNYPAPSHLWRFYPKDTSMACDNNRCFAVTGAIQVINTKDFFDIQGFNIGMGGAFQDIALCIEAFKQNKIVYYVGSEHMYHAESLTNVTEKITLTPDYASDYLLWEYLYGIHIVYILGYRYFPPQKMPHVPLPNIT